MGIFHKGINEKLAEHIFELEQVGLLTDDWYWDSQKVYKLKRIDEQLINDLLALYRLRRSDRGKFEQILQRLSVLLRILRKFIKESKGDATDRKFVILINRFVQEIERLLDNFPLRIGVTGYVTQKFDKQQALKYLGKAFDLIERKYPKRTKEVVGKLIDAGIYAIAYREATRRNWKTIGIQFSEFQHYPPFPVNKVVQSSHYAPYSLFMQTIDILVRVGGLYAARSEVNDAKKEEKEIYEYNVRAELKTIADIEDIQLNEYEIIRTRRDIKRVVEAPLLKACQILYDKNIRTVGSSANVKNVGQNVLISIDYDLLSDENKRVAESVGRITDHGDNKTAEILIPIEHRGVTVRYLEKKSVEIANKFEKQRMNWGVLHFGKVIQSLAQEGLGNEEIAKRLNLYYNQQERLFYLSKEHYRKTKE